MARPAPVIVLTAGAASTDALSYLGLGHVFPANMTGNTVLLGLGVATGDGAAALRSTTALGAYLTAALCFGAATAHGASPRRLGAGLAVELALLLAATVWWTSLSGPPRAEKEYGLIALFGAAMGTQSAVVQKLELPGVSTTYVTGTWTSLTTALGQRLRHRGTQPAEQKKQTEQYAQLTVVVTYMVAALLAAAAYVAWHAYAAFIPVGALVLANGMTKRHEPQQGGYERASGDNSG